MAQLDVDETIEFLESLTLDSEETWVVEDFQLDIIRDIASGVPEVVVVIPEGNAKTTLMAGISLAFARQNRMAKIPLAAASRDQAGLLFGQAADMVTRSGLDDEYRVYHGYRRITHLGTGSEIQVFAADDRTGDGAIFDIAFCDELHRMAERGQGLRLWRIWRGKLDKRGGQIVGISTAGAPGTEFEEMRDRMRTMGEHVRDGSRLRVATEDAILHDWALDPAADPEDFEAVARCNPLSTITVERLARRHRSPAMTPAHWLRFVCNVAVEEQGAWLPGGAWEACEDTGYEIPDQSPVFVGVDIGLKKDSSAVAWVFEAPDGRWDVRARVFRAPARSDDRLDLVLVENELRRLAGEFQVLSVAYDPHLFERSAQILEDEGLPMIEFPMTNNRVVPASHRLHDGICSRRIRHNGDPVLSAHVLAGVTQDTDRGWRIGKRKSRKAIDALVALMLAFECAESRNPAPTLEWVA